MARILKVHVGHPKTGSTFLQTVFRTNVEALRAHGVHYPASARHAELPAASITSGNGDVLMDVSFGELTERLRRAAADPAPVALFSNENLFWWFSDAEKAAVIYDAAREAGFQSVELLLFVRDPVELALSGWNQWVKRHGCCDPPESALAKIETQTRAADLLDIAERRRDVDATVLNYSRLGDRVLPATLDWLGVPADAVSLPTVERVNRSLSPPETVLQRALNRRLTNRPGVLADALCERLPEIPVPRMPVSTEAQSAFLERLAPALDRVDAVLPEGQRYRRDILPADPAAGSMAMTAEQLEVIGDVLGAEINRLEGIIADPASAYGARTLWSALLRRMRRQARRRFGLPPRRASSPQS